MSDSHQHKKALKDIETYVEHLKNIVNEMDKTLSDTNTSLPFSQNNQSRIAGVSGSVRDVSYYNWTNSLRR
jgi:uncharacterized FlaG/YvyC family protein